MRIECTVIHTFVVFALADIHCSCSVAFPFRRSAVLISILIATDYRWSAAVEGYALKRYHSRELLQKLIKIVKWVREAKGCIPFEKTIG